MQCIRIILTLIISLLGLQPVHAPAAPSASEIVARAEEQLWGKTVVGDFDMTITTPAWSRTLELQVWMDRPAKSFVRISAPAKDAGITSLRLESEMWNYLPAIERIVKIPPSMMLQPWLGSDFSNDDLVRESSIVNDYTHRMLDEKNLDGNAAYQIECLPKPGAPVVWGKIIYAIRKADFVSLRQEYFDERGEPIRALSYSDVRVMGGRSVPTRWEMRALTKPGKMTTIIVKSVSYDKPIDTDIFSLRGLKKKG